MIRITGKKEQKSDLYTELVSFFDYTNMRRNAYSAANFHTEKLSDEDYGKKVVRKCDKNGKRITERRGTWTKGIVESWVYFIIVFSSLKLS